MIKASELKPKNLLSTNSEEPEVIEVDAIDAVEETICGNGLTDVKIEDLLPIPLTPEWLERFGFDNTNCIYLGLDDGSKYLQVIRTTYDCLILGADNTISASLKPIKYVHQLQNLYFALTGQELELKEAAQK